jgi:hypothetical protein
LFGGREILFRPARAHRGEIVAHQKRRATFAHVQDLIGGEKFMTAAAYQFGRSAHAS